MGEVETMAIPPQLVEVQQQDLVAGNQYQISVPNQPEVNKTFAYINAA
jgi:hypothetical protein